jgi:hypothetical protein
MSNEAIATPNDAGNIPDFTKAARCTDGERLWGYFSAEAVGGKFYAWRVDGTLIGEFPTLGHASEAMIIYGRAP